MRLSGNREKLSQLARLGHRLLGIFTDIDDTLTHDGTLVPLAYARLAEAKHAGLRVVAVTGRPAGWAEVLAATWPVDAVIAENGAVAVYRRYPASAAGPGQSQGAGSGVSLGLERDYYQEDGAARKVVQSRLSAIRDRAATELPHVRAADDQWLRKSDLAFDIGELVTLPPDDIAQLRALIESEGARTLTSSVHLHAFFGDYDKAKMLVRLATRLWNEDLAANRDRYLFVGDSANDQAGFAFFPHSAAPSNVARYLPILQPPPTYIAKSPGGHGFAEIVGTLLEARERAISTPESPRTRQNHRKR